MARNVAAPFFAPLITAYAFFPFFFDFTILTTFLFDVFHVTLAPFFAFLIEIFFVLPTCMLTFVLLNLTFLAAASDVGATPPGITTESAINTANVFFLVLVIVILLHIIF